MKILQKTLIVLLGITFIFPYNSCKIFFPDKEKKEKAIFFPAPPDTARIQFLTTLSSSFDIEKKQSKFSKFVLGEEKPKTIIRPYGVETRHGKIYICDIGLKGFETIDLQKKIFEYFIPEGKGSLLIPVNCYVDAKGWLYVADSGRKQIVVYDKERKFVKAFSYGENFFPMDVNVTDDKIWVANMKGHSIDVFKNDTTYKYLYSFPNAAKGDSSYLYQPRNMEVKNKKIYVSDFGSFDVKVFSPEGKHVETVGQHGMNVGCFARPKGVAADYDGNVFAVDAAFGNVQIFNEKGQVLMFFGSKTSNNKEESGLGYLYAPAGISIDYDNLQFFEQFVDPEYKLKYVILVTSQYGPNKLNIYGRVIKKQK